MYNVIRKGEMEVSIDRAKRLGYWDAENQGAVVKQFETQQAAEEYAEACNSIWTERTAFFRIPEYLVVESK